MFPFRVIPLFAVVKASGRLDADRLASLPGFPDASTWGFEAYSGLLDVPGPVCGYDSLRIHYQFQTSSGDPARDPVNVWHNGGPGASSITNGLYGIVGAFRIGDDAHGNYLNPWSWNRISNMLYFESPAGSGGSAGYSQCLKGGEIVDCKFSDKTQAEAYAHTLQVFFAAFPEFANHEVYLSGESYFGQYGPHIAQYILSYEPFASSIRLKGIAAGNACWGGTETCLACNGPSTSKLDVATYFGKGLFSSKLYAQIQETCKFPSLYDFSLWPNATGHGADTCDGDHLMQQGQPVFGEGCYELLQEMHRQVGPHNIDNVYDNCAATTTFLEKVGKDQRWLRDFLQSNLHEIEPARAQLKEMNGGYDWDCGGSVASWITSDEVRSALHLDGDDRKPGASKLHYDASGPASHLLWPELAQKLRVLIFNGDADACVPLVGNEEWVLDLEQRGVLKEMAAWSPWYRQGESSPAGYETKYMATVGASLDFTFKTVRLAGHQVSTFQPEAGFQLISDFLSGSSRETQVVV